MKVGNKLSCCVRVFQSEDHNWKQILKMFHHWFEWPQKVVQESNCPNWKEKSKHKNLLDNLLKRKLKKNAVFSFVAEQDYNLTFIHQFMLFV